MVGIIVLSATWEALNYETNDLSDRQSTTDMLRHPHWELGAYFTPQKCKATDFGQDKAE